MPLTKLTRPPGQTQTRQIGSSSSSSPLLPPLQPIPPQNIIEPLCPGQPPIGTDSSSSSSKQYRDGSGNVYVYDKPGDSFVELGIMEQPPIVTEQQNGLVDPIIYQRLNYLRQLSQSGVKFEKTKIFIGDVKDNPYFYYLNSTDGTIKFKNELLIDGKKRLRIEVDRAKIIQRLTRIPCIGPNGPKGLRGDNGKNGIPASNEKFYTYKKIDTTTYELFTTVSAPLVDEPISLRLFRVVDKVTQYTEQILEILVPLTISESLTFVDTDNFTADQEATHLSYDGKYLRGKVVLKKGNFTNITNTWYHKARQRGPKGLPGNDGSPILVINNELADDQIRYTTYISSMRMSRGKDIAYTQVQVNAKIIANTLKMSPGQLPIGDNPFVLAVEPINLSAKDLAYYKFEPDTPNTAFQLPAWTPVKACANQTRFNMSSFRWFDNIDPGDPGCTGAIIPFTILTDPAPPVQCCRDAFFVCGNLGDSGDGTPTCPVLVPPKCFSSSSSKKKSSSSSSGGSSSSSSGGSSSSSSGSSSSSSSSDGSSSSSNNSSSSSSSSSNSGSSSSSSNSSSSSSDCPIPVITSELTKTGVVGSLLSYQITATNTPDSYNAVGLPVALSVDTGTGLITGIPDIPGVWQVDISATNICGTGNANPYLEITITAASSSSSSSSAAPSSSSSSS